MPATALRSAGRRRCRRRTHIGARERDLAEDDLSRCHHGERGDGWHRGLARRLARHARARSRRRGRNVAALTRGTCHSQAVVADSRAVHHRRDGDRDHGCTCDHASQHLDHHSPRRDAGQRRTPPRSAATADPLPVPPAFHNPLRVEQAALKGLDGVLSADVERGREFLRRRITSSKSSQSLPSVASARI